MRSIDAFSRERQVEWYSNAPEFRECYSRKGLPPLGNEAWPMPAIRLAFSTKKCDPQELLRVIEKYLGRFDYRASIVDVSSLGGFAFFDLSILDSQGSVVQELDPRLLREEYYSRFSVSRIALLQSCQPFRIMDACGLNDEIQQLILGKCRKCPESVGNAYLRVLKWRTRRPTYPLDQLCRFACLNDRPKRPIWVQLDSSECFRVNDSGLDDVCRREIREIVSNLPLQERIAVEARIWKKQSFEEIADAIGTSSATAYRRYHTGLGRLKTCLSSYHPAVHEL